jgi:hypothetical protein
MRKSLSFFYGVRGRGETRRPAGRVPVRRRHCRQAERNPSRRMPRTREGFPQFSARSFPGPSGMDCLAADRERLLDDV